MENLEVLLSLGGTILGLIATALTLLLKFVKNGKAKRIAEQILEISDAVLPYVIQAESFVNYSGEEKKTFVMTKANQFAIENKIKFNDALVSDKIEELVSMTKVVKCKNSQDNTVGSDFENERLKAIRAALAKQSNKN